MKKLLVIFCAIFFMAACSKKEEVPEVDFKGPTSGPDVSRVTPDYGPNDPVPVEPSSAEASEAPESEEVPAANPVE